MVKEQLVIEQLSILFNCQLLHVSHSVLRAIKSALKSRQKSCKFNWKTRLIKVEWNYLRKCAKRWRESSMNGHQTRSCRNGDWDSDLDWDRRRWRINGRGWVQKKADEHVESSLKPFRQKGLVAENDGTLWELNSLAKRWWVIQRRKKKHVQNVRRNQMRLKGSRREWKKGYQQIWLVLVLKIRGSCDHSNLSIC